MTALVDTPEISPPDTSVQAREVISRWNAGATPDTLAAFEAFPQLRLDKSIVLELAYEEYVRLSQAGQTIDPEEFCRRFGEFSSSVRKQIETHETMARQGLAESAARWPIAGEMVSDYRIIRKLGVGGFARAYLAEHVLTGKLMALKIGPMNLAEPRLLGQLNHDNVVPIHDARTLPGGWSLLAMPYLGGSTLLDLLDLAFAAGRVHRDGSLVTMAARRNGELDASAAQSTESYTTAVVRLALGVAEGLGYLHARGIFHRDLKPSNVLLTSEGRPVLLDFNLAGPSEDARNRGAGTLYYMAPEQLREGLQPKTAVPSDQRADLYTLGVMVYELLAGVRPFGIPSRLGSTQASMRHADAAMWLLAQQEKGARRLSTQVSGIEPALDELIHRCLSFRPEDRPQSAGEVTERLKALLHRDFQPTRRTQRARLLTAAVALASLLGVGGMGWKLATRPPTVERIKQRAAAAIAEGKNADAAAMLEEVARLEPDSHENWVRLGSSLLKCNRIALAEEAFAKALERKPEGRTHACLAYCLGVRHNAAGCEYQGLKAREAGFKSAAAVNNLAWARFKNLPKGDLNAILAQIRQEFDAALAMDPTLAAAYWNRAALGYMQWTYERDAVEFLDAAIADLDKFISLSPPTAEAHYFAAVYRAATWNRVPRRGDILRHLRSAHQLGRDLSKLPGNRLFAFLVGDPEFKTLVESPNQLVPAVAFEGLANPLAELP